jgi:hypothetical protein
MKGMLVFAALVAGGCNLIGGGALDLEYALDPQEYMRNFGGTSMTVPDVACSAAMDPCAMAGMNLPMGTTLSCDTRVGKCAATAQLRLSYTVDLSKQTSFPEDAIRYGINAVTVKEVRYWVMSNTLTVGVPAIDLYVAPASAKDETGGTKLGSLAALPAKSTACQDPADTDDKAGTAMVCDLPLQQAGINQLAAFAKDYRTPFQLIAHTVVSVKSGDPLPSGAFDFFVRPVITLAILK